MFQAVIALGSDRLALMFLQWHRRIQDGGVGVVQFSRRLCLAEDARSTMRKVQEVSVRYRLWCYGTVQALEGPAELRLDTGDFAESVMFVERFCSQSSCELSQ